MLSKKGLRPLVTTETSQNEIETFQNDVLRPILKLQHLILNSIFENYLQKMKQDFEIKVASERSQFIWQSLKNDLKLKNQLLGCIIGLLEKDEMNLYLSHENELAKRINAMLIKRIESIYC